MDGGSQAAADQISTPWQIEVELGDLAAGVYDLLVRVNGDVFFFKYFHRRGGSSYPGAAVPVPAPTVELRSSTLLLQLVDQLFICQPRNLITLMPWTMSRGIEKQTRPSSMVCSRVVGPAISG